MANLEITISGNMPDGTYAVTAKKASDKSIQYNADSAFIDGQSSIELASADAGDLINGFAIDDATQSTYAAVFEGVAVGASSGFNVWDSNFNVWGS